MNIKLVVLDMAGTTVRDDDAVNGCLREALKAGGFDVGRDEVNAVMGIPKPVAIRTLVERERTDGSPAPPSLVDELHRDFEARMLASTAPTPASGRCRMPSRSWGRSERRGQGRAGHGLQPADHRRHPRPPGLGRGRLPRRHGDQRRGAARPSVPRPHRARHDLTGVADPGRSPRSGIRPPTCRRGLRPDAAS